MCVRQYVPVYVHVVAVGHHIPRGDAAERDSVGDQERPIHPPHGRARRYSHLPLLHRRLHILPRWLHGRGRCFRFHRHQQRFVMFSSYVVRCWRSFVHIYVSVCVCLPQDPYFPSFYPSFPFSWFPLPSILTFALFPFFFHHKRFS